MSKFKVGDKVRFIGDLSAHIFCDTLDNHKNDLTICKVCGDEKSYHVKTLGINDIKWCFDDDELELFEKEGNVESLYPHLIQSDSKWSDIIQQRCDELYKHYTLAVPCEKESVDVPLTIDDSVDALRYCINDLIATNNCCEKIKEEKNMNKVVTLWYERKRKSIEKKYDKLREEFGEKQYGIIESFNELVDKFNKDLDDLFQFDKASEQFVLVNNAPNNVIKYKIDVNKLDEEFNEMYRDEIRKAYKKIDDTREEVEAQLSLSDDLKYQQEVLERYNIISKKTKKISD